MNAQLRVPPSHKPRLRRTIVVGSLCIAISALGMVVARPLAAHFLRSSPWVLPAIAVAVLSILVVAALVVLPRLVTPR